MYLLFFFLQGLRHSLEKHLDESTKTHLNLMCSVVSKQHHQITSLKSALQRLSLNQTGEKNMFQLPSLSIVTFFLSLATFHVLISSCLIFMMISLLGTLVWKISDYTSKMSEAKTKEGMELVSPPFYTSQYGYKLQASIFLNGNGAGEGTHMSVYIKILPGEYDALLRWPFAHSVSFTLFDQTSVPEKVSYNENMEHFKIQRITIPQR